MLLYKGEAIHASGCGCCAIRFADAKPRAIDPTGTSGIRAAMRAALTLRFNRIRAMVRSAIVQDDMLGLRGGVSSAMAVAAATAGGSSRIEMFQRFIDTVLAGSVLEQNGGYLKQYIERCYTKGWAFAADQAPAANSSLALHVMQTQKVDAIAKLAFVELQGICEAVSQQAVRAVAQGIISQTHPNRIAKAVYGVLQKIGVERARTVAEYVTVYAFKEATLDAYQEAKVESVGLIPETRATIKARDALQDAPQRQTRRRGFGSRSSRTEAPSRRTVQRIRRQEAEVVEAVGGRVKVVTAEDDKVCPVCEAIADRGPYTINKARTLIPAHPRCRCLFKPARRRRDD